MDILDLYWHANTHKKKAQNDRRRRQTTRPGTTQDEHTTTHIQLAVQRTEQQIDYNRRQRR